MAKTYPVEITATAEADVEETWEYITQDSPEAATAFLLRLEEHLDTLEKFPEHCPRIQENQLLGTTYRHLLHGNYRIIFRMSGEKVIIMRVLHGARLLDIALLKNL